MTYSAGGEIQATDFDNIVGATTSTTTTQFNCLWGVGQGNYGLGQTPISNVGGGGEVFASDWANLISATNIVANHQATSITTVSPPGAGQLITYQALDPTNVNAVLAHPNNARGQGTAITSSVTTSGSWQISATFTHTITFGSGNQARYFFNAGGQIKIQCSHPQTTGNAINVMFQSMATAMGTLVLGLPSSTIAGSSYNGFTQVGGSSGTVTNIGYYGLTSSNQQTFIILPSGTIPSGYSSSYISVNIRTNGTQNSNGDKGSVLYITTTWTEVLPAASTRFNTFTQTYTPDIGLPVQPSITNTTVNVIPPTTAYSLINSWGTPTVSGSVAVS